MDTIAEQLKRINEADSGKPRKAVLVLGAGMAGLSAAYELVRLGHVVRIVEASDRVGGRVMTHRFPSGQYHECGAMRIPAGHDYTRHYVSVAGLGGELRPFITAHKQLNCFYHFRGQVARIRNARNAILPSFRLSGAEWKVASTLVAPAIFGVHLARVLRQLMEEDREALFAEGLLTGPAREIDSLTLGEFLDRHLVGEDTKELIGLSTGLEVWWDKALSMFIRDEIVGTGEGLEEIAGGMDRLPTNLADKVGRQRIHFNSEVVSISRLDQGALVHVRHTDGQVVEERADHVICTIPFGVLRRMNLSGFSYLKLRAIRNLNYASSTKVLLHCSQRFWEMGTPEERIIGGASFSDGISRATYYPSDHAQQQVAGFADVAESPLGFRGLHTSFAKEGASPTTSEFGFVPSPGVLVGSYNWGRDARRLGALAPNERGEAVIEVVEHFHPEIRRYVDESPMSMFWDSYQWSRGAFCFMNPNDLQDYYYGAIRPEGGLHFAGEHCSLDQGWIQGALMSGLRTVEEIVRS